MLLFRYKERQQLQVHEAMSGGIIVRKIERLPDQSLLIRKITLEDQGLYTCRAINAYGQDINDVQLDIFGRNLNSLSLSSLDKQGFCSI